jgi:hypothetical protein
MATGVIKSLKLDHGLVIVKLDGRSPDVALRVCGSDKRTVATMRLGQKIRFDLSCARDGRVFAIDVMPDTTLPRDGADPDSSSHSGPVRKNRCNGTDRRHFGKSVGGLRTGQYWMTAFEEADLEELLAAPVIRRLMERDGVDPRTVRALVQSIARATGRAR